MSLFKQRQPLQDQPSDQSVVDPTVQQTAAPEAVAADAVVEQAVEEQVAQVAEPEAAAIVPVDRQRVEELLALAVQSQDGDAVTELFHSIMRYAHQLRASDVHMEPEVDDSTVRIRVDGILHDEIKVPNALHRQMVAVLKILTRMRTDEHRAPQDGRYTYASALGEVDVRASIIPVTTGEKAVLRLLSSQSHKLNLEQLGFSEPDLERIKRAIHKPWGMILTTGPTGAGKSTTIYAILEILNTREVNIATIEDPVEFDIIGVNQSQVDISAKLTFANGLRALLRQDPDIIGVGEIRDEETAKIAVNAALTGHKLLSTLHTNSAAATIPRLIDMHVEPFLISSTLICAVAQRLMRRICDDCKGEKQLTKAEAQPMANAALIDLLFAGGDPIAVADAKGCDKCNNSGYKGRIGIYEVLENSKAIQELIVKRSDSDTIQAKAIEEGMTTIVQDGVRKVLSKVTTLDELIRALQE
jgi:type II secretory ATPase GspE/PulE/Tfp pilus assembly ATPase PilB-like protein